MATFQANLSHFFKDIFLIFVSFKKQILYVIPTVCSQACPYLRTQLSRGQKPPDLNPCDQVCHQEPTVAPGTELVKGEIVKAAVRVHSGIWW